MLTQPAALDPTGPRPAPDRPQTWLILATDRLREFHASIYALGPNGGIRKSPPYAEYPAREVAIGELHCFGVEGKLDHAKYTYTIFRSS